MMCHAVKTRSSCIVHSSCTCYHSWCLLSRSRWSFDKCRLGLPHGRSVWQEGQDKSVGYDADVGLHLHGSYNQGERPQDRGHKITGTFWLFPGVECLITIGSCASRLPPALLCGAQCPSASTRSMLNHCGGLSPVNLIKYILCVFETFRVLSLSLFLEPVRTDLCVLRVTHVVPDTLPGAVDPILRVLCVL